MSDLTDFLLARFAEDEKGARAATPSPWVPGSQGWDDANGHGFIVAPYHELDISDEDVQHVTRWQPGRVLTECEAKRQIVEDLRDELANQHDPEPTTLQLAERTLLTLALPYADHPDFREEWRP